MDNLFTFNSHEAYMSRALELARKGRSDVSPNPMVGCVLVKDGEIIGEGYHEKYGESHAEVMAFNNAHKDPSEALLYVNLEPCCISAKTPPCIEAIIQNSISEVYVGMLDPNPEINGKGVDALEKAGIKVHVGVLNDECEKLNRSFTKLMNTGMPWVIAKVAQTIDGYMGINSNSSIWITGQESKKNAHYYRSMVDAVLIGRKTAEVDDPSLTVREIDGKNPIRIILDTNRVLPYGLKIFSDKQAKTIVLCSSKRFDRTSTHACQYIPVKEINGCLSPEHILRTLAQEGILTLMIEGGHEVLKSFYEGDLIDEIHVYTAPYGLDDAKLKNPIKISEDWMIKEELLMGKDKLIIAEKGVECLPELSKK